MVKQQGVLIGPFFIGTIMKNYIKMRVIATKEIYYTFPHWKSNFVDGVEFLPVNKFEPSQDRTQTIYYVRKDSLEKVK